MLTQPSLHGLARKYGMAFGNRISLLRRKGFLRSAVIMSSGSAAGHLFTLAAGPILTRIYGPNEFGMLGLFTSLLSIVVVAVTLQYEISIVIGKDEHEAAYLTFASLLLAAPISILSGGVLWFLIHNALLGYGALPWFAPLLMILSVAFIGCFTTLRYWALREGRFNWIAQASVVQSAARAILQTVFGAVGLKVSGLLMGEALGRCMGMSRVLRGAWPTLRRHARRFKWSELLGAMKRHRKFPLYSFPSSLLDALCLALPLPLLVQMYGVALGGQYSLVWKAITVPSVLISVSIADTFHSTLANSLRDSPERVTRIYRKASLGLLLAGLVPAAVLMLWGPVIFAWAFGAPWSMAGSIAAIIAPWYLAQFVTSPLSRVVVVLSGQEVKLIWDVLCLLSLLAVFSTARFMSLSPLQTITALSAVNTLLYVVYYLMLSLIVARFEKSRVASIQPS
jgi:O-antigen/teichoic acid export membrane protein